MDINGFFGWLFDKIESVYKHTSMSKSYHMELLSFKNST